MGTRMRLVTAMVVLAALAGTTTAVHATPAPSTPPTPPPTAGDTVPLDDGAPVEDEDTGPPPRPHSPEDPDRPDPRPPGAPTVAPAPPPPLNLGAIEVLIEERRAAVAAAEARHAAQVAAAVDAAKKAAGEAEAAARARLEAETRSVEEARAALEAARGRLDTARSEQRAATQRHRDALRRIRSVAAGGFAGASDSLDPMAAAVFGDRDLADATSTAVYATAAAHGAVGEVRRADQAERDAARAVRNATTAVEDAESVVADAQGEHDRAQSALEATLIANEVAIATAATLPPPPELLVSDPDLVSIAGANGPTILGPSLVPAEDLAAFVRARGRPHPSVNVEELAEFFLAEGALEGVAADIAWVQAIIETGWFSFGGSMVRPTDHNYAGIGACDSCRRGFVFDTPQIGARAQMQLLRIYATPGLRTHDLANPPVRTVPERLGVRGCCGTWMELSGVWATGPGYGIKILNLYNQLLTFSAARR